MSGEAASETKRSCFSLIKDKAKPITSFVKSNDSFLSGLLVGGLAAYFCTKYFEHYVCPYVPPTEDSSKNAIVKKSYLPKLALPGLGRTKDVIKNSASYGLTKIKDLKSGIVDAIRAIVTGHWARGNVDYPQISCKVTRKLDNGKTKSEMITLPPEMVEQVLNETIQEAKIKSEPKVTEAAKAKKREEPPAPEKVDVKQQQKVESDAKPTEYKYADVDGVDYVCVSRTTIEKMANQSVDGDEKEEAFKEAAKKKNGKNSKAKEDGKGGLEFLRSSQSSKTSEGKKKDEN